MQIRRVSPTGIEVLGKINRGLSTALEISQPRPISSSKSTIGRCQTIVKLAFLLCACLNGLTAMLQRKIFSRALKKRQEQEMNSEPGRVGIYIGAPRALKAMLHHMTAVHWVCIVAVYRAN